MPKINMKETDYYKSGKHYNQIRDIATQALESIQRKKNDRIAVYNLSPTQCSCCNVSLPYVSRKNKFCTKSCAAQFNNIRRAPRSQESRARTSISSTKHQDKLREDRAPYSRVYHRICETCNLPFLGRSNTVKNCSKDCKSIQQGNWLRVNRNHILGNGNKSYMETSFSEWLTVNYTGRWHDEIHFYNEETKKHGWIDFVFPREKVIIELDGSHHIKRKHLDDIRDEYLTRVRGYTVIRITQPEYKKKSRVWEICQTLGITVDI